MKGLEFVAGIAIASTLFINSSVNSQVVEPYQEKSPLKSDLITESDEVGIDSRKIVQQIIGRIDLGTLNRAQQFHRLNNSVFASRISDLKHQVESSKEFFDYKIIAQSNPMNSAVLTATSKVEGLNSLIGIVWQDDHRFTQLICETIEPSMKLPSISKYFTTLNPARQCPDGMKPIRRKAGRHILGMLLRSQMSYRVEFGRFTKDISLLNISPDLSDQYLYTVIFPTDPTQSVIIKAKSTMPDSKYLVGIVTLNPSDDDFSYQLVTCEALEATVEISSVTSLTKNLKCPEDTQAY